jgi:nucleoside-diphosphate-sugar epimerase
LSAACQDFDCIVHLAGRAHVLSEHDQNPLEAFRRANCGATLRLAQQAVESGVRRFIFISSIGVNGAETSRKPFDEFSNPKPHADYAISKLEAEEGLKKLLAGTETELVIIRPPLVYGVDAPGNFARLLKFVATGLPLPLGRINNRRSIVSLENLVSFISLCIEHSAAAGQLFLVSDGEDISTTEMVLALAQGMGKKPLMLPVPDSLLKVGAKLLGKESLYTQLCCSLQVDSSKARSLLGWKPQENTLEALEKIGRLCVVPH